MAGKAKCRVQCYVRKEIKQELSRLAEKYDRSESDLCRVVVENFVKQQLTKEKVRANG